MFNMMWNSTKNKESVVSGLQNRITALKKEIKELQSDKTIADDTKQKKIAKRQLIIKNCQETINSQIAYIQMCEASKLR